jgi:hypothetical protein
MRPLDKVCQQTEPFFFARKPIKTFESTKTEKNHTHTANEQGIKYTLRLGCDPTTCSNPLPDRSGLPDGIFSIQKSQFG